MLDRGYTYFRELRKGEVRGMPFIRSSVHTVWVATRYSKGIMPEMDKPIRRDLRCQKHDHPFRAEIRQTVHTVEGGEITNITTPKGALDNVRCPECGSLPKDPND